jgi:hypothetical protein
MSPPWQEIFPSAQTPGAPVEQSPPVPGMLSSAVPLQSLSRSSQVSPTAIWLGTHTGAAPTHCMTPAAQTPSMPLSHIMPLSGKLSSVS